MAPSTATAARRGAGTRRKQDNPLTSSSSSDGSSPESDSPEWNELSDDLIQFISKTATISEGEPPRKKQKMTLERDKRGNTMDNSSQEFTFDHVVVKQSTWDIHFSTCKLSDSNGLIERDNIQPILHWPRDQPLESIEILDEAQKSIFRRPLPDDVPDYEDITIALQIDNMKSIRIKWATDQGKLWTELKLVLLQEGGKDVLRIVFTVKWKFTTSPEYIFQANNKIPVLPLLLEKYFPDPNVSNANNWTPQDFYQSVHVPDKHDEISAALKVDGLRSNLYPFQKRAVQWLLKMEGVEWSATEHKIIDSPHVEDSSLPLSFIKVNDALGRTCYVSHLYGLVTSDPTPFRLPEQELKGGILCEEMGLGKTVEMISLITLHKRPYSQALFVPDPYTGEDVRPTSATLIIAPPVLSLQWIAEVEKHAPHLKVKHYKGIKAYKGENHNELIEELATADIVISTYYVLTAEIHFTPLNPEKTLRRASKYPRARSPLMALQFFRVVMDEAQMIESGVSAAAKLARMVPRVNAWCVTGTPITKEVGDLLGQLTFLRYEPFASTKHVWTSLITSHKPDFRKLFGTLAMRHTKQSIRDEIKLPAQRRYVVTMPFTPVEEQHYRDLFSQMCEECGLDIQGAPLIENWDSDRVTETMRQWLSRLRQTALHPQIGNRNRRALGHKNGPLRTIDQVVDLMVEQTDLAIRSDQRNLLTCKLKRGQLFERSPRVKEALAIWNEVANEALEIVKECRKQLEKEIARGDGKDSLRSSRSVTESDADSADEQKEVEASSRLGPFRNRLRAALEIEHMAKFFCASAYYQIKSNEEMTKPDSAEFRALEKLEIDGYEEAKKLRREILQEISRKVDRLMKRISKKAASQAFVELPEFPSDSPRGIESRTIGEKLDVLAAALNMQANQLDEWREETIQSLLKPLVDEDDGIETTGDEYEESTRTQDEVVVYVQALRTVTADRHDLLTGQENKLVQHEARAALKLAKEGQGPFPEKTLALLNARNQLKPDKQMGSIRGIVSELKALTTTLRTDVHNGSSRARDELRIVENQLAATQKHLSEQAKATVGLEKEIEFFTNVMNTRVEYYRQLQAVSDMVAPYEGPKHEAAVMRMLEEENKFTNKVAAGKVKRNYLIHLQKEAKNPKEQRLCVICKDTFELGSLTACGHQFCKECIMIWWSSHKKCPLCKETLNLADMHDITYKPQELVFEAEEVGESRDRASPSSTSKKSAIYSEISKSTLTAIKNVDLNGPSFTTKVDTLARHLLWLRESDPGSKSIIYSQFKEFLDVLASAFKIFRIGYSSIDKPGGIESFKNDPSIECFLLHSRAHSSGLNLVNASHVFLCEPLLNTALELQAIARVDRIGQEQETSVWLYLVDGTVEESIYQLSVKRRMEHIGQRLLKGKGKARELNPEQLLDGNLEAANSLELQEASLAHLLEKGKGGEIVENEDLWECLFGGAGQQKSAAQRTLDNSDLRNNVEVARHIRAEAAEGRVGS
ncbi:hypothetical protein G7Y89_g8800 [Cudoniella acicularis]|uniref:Uncharacterized protein n=1 Tax=Cudoniella acicularis TaxID=354080 RepID=A0A8H4RIR1_9HELO|nr:hypothetical protein G7Y89_g8800 [Cudoniella acicularis]